MAEGTLLGALRDPRAGIAASFVGARLPDRLGLSLQGELTSPEEGATEWIADVPDSVLNEDWDVVRDPDPDSWTVARAGRPAGISVGRLLREEQQDGQRYRGRLQTGAADEGSPLEFDVFTDPEPMIVVVLAVVAVGCVVDWFRRGGKTDCQAQFADLTSECMRLGGTPDIRLRSTIGVSARDGFHIGCHQKCDFVCHRS
jgi:hypothetical protein